MRDERWTEKNGKRVGYRYAAKYCMMRMNGATRCHAKTGVNRESERASDAREEDKVTVTGYMPKALSASQA